MLLKFIFQAWLILVLLCAHNPTEFGATAWEDYPTLRASMEMCITNQVCANKKRKLSLLLDRFCEFDGLY
jgi:hypothetical protein